MRRTAGAVGIVVGAVLVVTAAPGVGQDADVVVEAARQLSGSENPVRLYVSPDVAVHPGEPSTLAVTLTDARNGGCSVATSRDGGLSWTESGNMMPVDLPFCVQRNFGRVADAAFASNGTLYVALSGSNAGSGHPNGPITALLARTSDLGATFETNVAAEPGEYVRDPDDGPEEVGFGQHRISTLAVDPGDPDVVYRAWREWKGGVEGNFRERPQSAQVVVSTDGGRTWSDITDPFQDYEPQLADPEAEKFHTDTLEMVVHDGTVYGFTKNRPPSAPEGAEPFTNRLLMVQSSDQGANWTTTIVHETLASLDNPSVAVAGNGDLHLAWAERRGEEREDPLEVMYARSSDAGATWSDPVNVTDDDPAGGWSQYFPGISVAPNGRVDIAWHDFRDDPFFTPGELAGMGSAAGQRWSDVYLASSTDGGRSWSPNVRVTDRSIDREVGVTFNNQDIRGPVGIASTDGTTYLTWADSRGGRAFDAEDAYFTRVRHAGAAVGAATTSTRVVWSVLGAGVALALAGLVLVIGGRRARSGGALAVEPVDA